MLLLALLLMLISTCQSQVKHSPCPSQDSIRNTDARVDEAGHFHLRVITTKNSLEVFVNKLQLELHDEIGVFLIVLDEVDGTLLTHRFYNIFLKFWGEQLTDFITTIRDGRVVILVSQGAWTDIMGRSLVQHLVLMGSQHVRSLKLMTQWVFVVQQGYSVLKEERNPDGQIDLQFNVALKLDDDKTIGDTCINLLTSGHLGEFKQWQPDGCRMHQYTPEEANSCLKTVAAQGGRTYIALTGDSRIYSLFVTLVQLINPAYINENTDEHVSYVDMASELLIEFAYNVYADESIVDYFTRMNMKSKPPQMIVAGNAIWSMRKFQGSRSAVDQYSRNLTLLVPAINGLAEKNTKVIWTLQKPTIPDRLWGKLRDHLANEQVFLYNDAAFRALRPSDVHIWSSIRRIAEGNMHECVDGVHHGRTTFIQEGQILLNLICNKHMEWEDDTVCCSKNANRNHVVSVSDIDIDV